MGDNEIQKTIDIGNIVLDEFWDVYNAINNIPKQFIEYKRVLDYCVDSMQESSDMLNTLDELLQERVRHNIEKLGDAIDKTYVEIDSLPEEMYSYLLTALKGTVFSLENIDKTIVEFLKEEHKDLFKK